MSDLLHLDRIPVTRDPAALAKYLSDESSAYVGHADAAYLPRTDDEMAQIVKAAAATGTPVTVAGAGTSLTGAGVPAGGIVLSTERVRRTQGLTSPDDAAEWTDIAAGDFSFRVSVERQEALVPAGLRLFELNQALERTGLFYPPDPTEASAMVGGTVATNASGARSYRYGPTRSWVEGLLVVSAVGGSAWIRRGEHVAYGGSLELPSVFGGGAVSVSPGLELPATKNASGLQLTAGVDLVDLIVGSEGILCAVAAVLVRLTPRPTNLLQIASFYSSQAAAFEAANAMRGLEEEILSIEYFDPASLDFMRADHPDIPPAPAACVLFELPFLPKSEGNPYPSPALIHRWEARLTEYRSFAHWAVTGAEVEAMKGFRHSLPEQVNRWVGEHVGKLGTDMAVPASAFPKMVEAYEESRGKGIRSVLFGHLGQYHLHLNFLPETQEELTTAKALYRGLAETAVHLGGTISAEHGVGKKRLTTEYGEDRPYLWFMYGFRGLEVIASVKQAFDPQWVLNRGTMVPKP